MLRTLLHRALQDDDVERLAQAAAGAPQRAFASSSLRPFLIAALLESAPFRDRPALIVASDDRMARDLALDLRAFLAPAPVRFYPARGVRYESHLAPPPHLVGLRIAALDSLLEPPAGQAPVVVASAVALMERIPDPDLRPHGFAIAVGEDLDLDETLERLVACGYEREEQVVERGQFAVRGGILDVYPATEERAVRVELFGDEVESLRWFSTFTQRSLEDAERVEIAPAAELDAGYRELAEMAATESDAERPDIAEVLPVDDFRSFLELMGENASVLVAAEEELRPALADHWQDVTTSLHSDDAHDLYLPPERVSEALETRAEVTLSAVSSDQPHQFRAQAADTAARTITEAEPELEKLVRSGYAAVVAWDRRGEAERAAYNLARLRPRFVDDGEHIGEGLWFAQARVREGFIAPQLKVAVIPDHRLLRRRRAERPEGTRGRAFQAFTELRPGDIVVHTEHGIGRFTGFDTKTVAGVTRDYLEVEYRDGDRVFVPTDQLDRLSRYVGAEGAAPPLSKLGSKTWDNMKARAKRAAAEMAGELINLYAERQRRAGHAYDAGLRLAARVRARVPLPRDRRPARGDRADQGRHGVGAADGPPDLRRRRLRQDRGRAASRVQGRGRGPADDGAGAHDDPGPAALRHVLRAAARLPVPDRAAVAVPQRRRSSAP